MSEHRHRGLAPDLAGAFVSMTFVASHQIGLA
jgi:hypothetical protein